jgi:hypothetical protein
MRCTSHQARRGGTKGTCKQGCENAAAKDLPQSAAVVDIAASWALDACMVKEMLGASTRVRVSTTDTGGSTLQRDFTLGMRS